MLASWSKLAFLLLSCLCLACSSETDSAIDDYESLVDDMIEITKGMEKAEVSKSPKVLSLMQKAKETEDRVQKLQDQFTPEQKERLAAILLRAKGAADQMH